MCPWVKANGEKFFYEFSEFHHFCELVLLLLWGWLFESPSFLNQTTQSKSLFFPSLCPLPSCGFRLELYGLWVASIFCGKAWFFKHFPSIFCLHLQRLFDAYPLDPTHTRNSHSQSPRALYAGDHFLLLLFCCSGDNLHSLKPHF